MQDEKWIVNIVYHMTLCCNRHIIFVFSKNSSRNEWFNKYTQYFVTFCDCLIALKLFIKNIDSELTSMLEILLIPNPSRWDFLTHYICLHNECNCLVFFFFITKYNRSIICTINGHWTCVSFCYRPLYQQNTTFFYISTWSAINSN